MNKPFACTIILLVLLVSCKKSENDPLISIYSREKRLCQDWELVETYGTFSKYDIFGQKLYVYARLTYKDSHLILKSPDISESFDFSFNLNIGKDGNYSYVESYVRDGKDFQNEGTSSWQWLDLDKEKNGILFSDLDESLLFTFLFTKKTKDFVIDRLAKKELVILEKFSLGNGYYETMKDFKYTFRLKK